MKINLKRGQKLTSNQGITEHMKEETIDISVIVIAIITLIILFVGDPDVIDGIVAALGGK